jgi:hypothetical protein
MKAQAPALRWLNPRALFVGVLVGLLFQYVVPVPQVFCIAAVQYASYVANPSASGVNPSSFPATLYSFMQSSDAVVIVALLNAVNSLLAGYCVAHVAPHARVRHAVVVGCLTMLIGVLGPILSSNLNWTLLVSSVLTVVMTGAGGYLYTRIKRSAGSLQPDGMGAEPPIPAP